MLHISLNQRRQDKPLQSPDSSEGVSVSCRGSQRLLDFAECRLALAEELCGDQIVHIVNGVNRTGAVDALTIQLLPETYRLISTRTLSFDTTWHSRARPDKSRFLNRCRGIHMDGSAGDSIGGKAVTKDTLSGMLRTAKVNRFVVQDRRPRNTEKCSVRAD